METLGRQMIIQCECLPLAIIVLGGILATKTSLQEWKKVNENIQWYMKNVEGIGQQNKGEAMEVLSSSYDDLPYQLKPCFLYLAKFPEDSEIEAERLYHLWMAESMVLVGDQKEGESMMDVAERYLGELSQRCMVQVQLEENHEYRPRKFKSCRLHDLMRIFCTFMAKEEDFINIFEFQPKNDRRVESLSNKTRRVFISYDGKDVSGRDISFTNEVSHEKLRSILFFSSGVYKGRMHSVVTSIIRKFKFLRVLLIEGLYFDAVIRSEMESSKLFLVVIALAKAIGSLIHLRYLSLRKTKFILNPLCLRNLKHLQTLDIREILFPYINPCKQNALRQMSRLQHLYLPKGDIARLERHQKIAVGWLEQSGDTREFRPKLV